MKLEKEYTIIAQSILDILPNGFKKAVLEIKRLEGNVGFTGFYVTAHGAKEWLDIFNLKLDPSHIHKVYNISSNGMLATIAGTGQSSPCPDHKFEMEYIWDQKLQDEVDRYNKESQS